MKMSRAIQLLTIFVLMVFAMGELENYRCLRAVWDPAYRKCRQDLHLNNKRITTPEEYLVFHCVFKELKVREGDHYVDGTTDNQRALIAYGRTLDGCIQYASSDNESEEDRQKFSRCYSSARDALVGTYRCEPEEN